MFYRMSKKAMVAKAPIQTAVRCQVAMRTAIYNLRIKIVIIIECRVDLVMRLNIVTQWRKPQSYYE